MEIPGRQVPEASFRTGYVAIIGEPNVGKSTLMNCLIGQKISIVTSKPQTTRHKILAILSRDSYQIIFLDTPGILKPVYMLHKAMMESSKSAINDADLILYMIDCSASRARERSSPGTQGMREQVSHRTQEQIAHGPRGTQEPYIGDDAAFSMLKELRKPVFLIINKVDKINREEVARIIATYSGSYPF